MSQRECAGFNWPVDESALGIATGDVVGVSPEASGSAVCACKLSDVSEMPRLDPFSLASSLRAKNRSGVPPASFEAGVPPASFEAGVAHEVIDK